MGNSIGDLNIRARLDGSQLGGDVSKAVQTISQQFNLKRDLMRVNSPLSQLGLGLNKNLMKGLTREAKGLLGDKYGGFAAGLGSVANILGPVGLVLSAAKSGMNFVYDSASKEAQTNASGAWKDFRKELGLPSAGKLATDLVNRHAAGLDVLTASSRYVNDQRNNNALTNFLSQPNTVAGNLFKLGRIGYTALNPSQGQLADYNPAKGREMLTPYNWQETDLEGYSDKLTMAAMDLLKDQDESMDEAAGKHHQRQKEHDHHRRATERGLRGG